MALARPRTADFVKETTDTTGTGTFSLAGAVSGFRSFSVVGDGAVVYYTIVDNPNAVTAYEIGIGTFTAGSPNTLSRTRIIASSNGGSKVDWVSGTKTIICNMPAELLNSVLDAMDSDLVTTGTSTAYSVTTYRESAVGLFEGRFICVKLHTANGSNPTLNVDGLGAKAIVDINGTAPAAGSMPASYFFFKYDATATKWVVFSPFNMGAASSRNLGADVIDDGAGNLTATEALIVKTDSYTLDIDDDRRQHFYFLLSAPATVTAPSAVTGGSKWSTRLSNAPSSSDSLTVVSTAGNFYGGNVINGVSFGLAPGESCIITSSGVVWIISAWQRNQATTNRAGIVKLSTDAEAKAKSSAITSLTPSNLAALTYMSASGTVLSSVISGAGTGFLRESHGLSSLPQSVAAFIQCISTDQGYAVGDTVNLMGCFADGADPSCSVWKSTTQVGAEFNNQVRVTPKGGTTGSAAAVDTSKWKVYLGASLF